MPNELWSIWTYFFLHKFCHKIGFLWRITIHYSFLSFQHLASLLIVTQLMGQIFESVVPYLVYKRRKKEIQAKSGSKQAPEGIEQLTPSDGIDEGTRLHAEIEAAKDEFQVRIQQQLALCTSCNKSSCQYHVVEFVRSNLNI